MYNDEARSPVEPRGLNSKRETIRIDRVILRSALGFLHSARAEVGYSAGGHRHQFEDIRRVGLSNLGTRSAART
eukprot:6914506-Pyramimonas_sp.AAC.1